jgi:argininosuccinate lyase
MLPSSLLPAKALHIARTNAMNLSQAELCLPGYTVYQRANPARKDVHCG